MTDEQREAWRRKLRDAIEGDHAKTINDLVRALGSWCHEGVSVDMLSAGVCSHEVKHDGTVDGALAALREVGRMILKDIDDGSEGC